MLIDFWLQLWPPLESVPPLCAEEYEVKEATTNIRATVAKVFIRFPFFGQGIGVFKIYTCNIRTLHAGLKLIAVCGYYSYASG